MFKKVFNKNIHNNIYVKFSTNMLYFIIITTLFILFNLLFSGKVYATNSPISPTKEITVTKIWENDKEAVRPNDIKVHLKKTSTTLIEGEQLNTRMKNMAIYNGTSYAIKKIVRATDEEFAAMQSSLNSNNEIQTPDSTIKVYMWYVRVNTTKNGVSYTERTMYYYSEADNIYLNPNSAKLFNLAKLEDISDLAYFNTSYVTNMSQMFYNCVSLSDISPLSNWNVSNVENMSQMFAGINSSSGNLMKISDLTPLSNWDVSNVTDMSSMFEYNYNSAAFKYLAPIVNWNVKNVTNFNNMFRYTRVTDSNVITGWDSATNSYSSNGWDVSAVLNANFSKMFDNASNKPNKSFYLRNGTWNTTNGTYTPTTNPISVQVSHPYTTPNADEFTTTSNNWVKNGNEWTYTFTVNNDNSIYSVWEEPVSYYTSEAVQTSPIQIIDNTATITNTFYNTYDITLIKKVTGNIARLNEDFEFEITIYDENNNQLSDNITIERDGTQIEITNNSKINLKHNEQIIIKDIIAGYKYTITETNTDYDESYKIDKTDETNEGEKTILIQTFENIIEKQSLNENQTVTFINNKDSVPETMVDINFQVYVYIIILSTAIIIATKHFTNN